MFAKESFKSQPLAPEQLRILGTNTEAEGRPPALTVRCAVRRLRLLMAVGRREFIAEL